MDNLELDSVLYFPKKVEVLELAFAEELVVRNIKYKHQPFTVTLLNAGSNPYPPYNSVRDTKYTPDFYFEFNGRKIVVEIKGFMRGDNALRYKLAYKYFIDQGIEFYVLKQRGSIRMGDKNFYLYDNKNHNKMVSREATKKRILNNFWNIAGISQM